MEKTFLRMQIRVITKPEEKCTQFEEALKVYYAEEKEPFPITIDSFMNVTEHEQHILTVVFQKARHIRYATEKLFEQLTTEQITEIISQLDSRIDDECHFFIRLDKHSFLKNEYVLTQSGDCIHFMLSVAAYPSRKDIAFPLVEKYLNAKI